MLRRGLFLHPARALRVAAFSSKPAPPRVLVTGATGQIGLELVPYLRDRYGAANVLATDIKPAPPLLSGGPFAYLDVVDPSSVARLVVEHKATLIVHLASLLSAVGERNPKLAMTVNARGLENVLDIAATNGCRVFAPSTIAVFGPSTPRDNTPEDTVLRPTVRRGDGWWRIRCTAPPSLPHFTHPPTHPPPDHLRRDESVQ